MAKISDVLAELEKVAPLRYAFEFDRVGLQVGEEHAPVTKAAVSLDRSLGAIRFARDQGCQLLLSHHPLIFSPLEDVTNRSHTSRSVLELVRHNIAFIAAHTNWDSAQDGINDVLAGLLDLKNVKPFGSGASISSKKLVFFSPADAIEKILDALSETGAGMIGAYSRCSFRSEGQGAFKGDENTSPTIGRPNEPSIANECRVEVILPPGTERAAERAVLRTHPYETPAFDIYPLSPHIEQPAGRIGEQVEKTSFAALLSVIDQHLSTVSYGWGDPEKPIHKVAVVGGAADGEWIHAQRAGADVLITGEVKQHVAVEASESGLCIVAAGHYATEHPGAIALGVRMSSALPDVEWISYQPEPGFHGRPAFRL